VELASYVNNIANAKTNVKVKTEHRNGFGKNPHFGFPGYGTM
jgi:hypothetical protein